MLLGPSDGGVSVDVGRCSFVDTLGAYDRSVRNSVISLFGPQTFFLSPSRYVILHVFTFLDFCGTHRIAWGDVEVNKSFAHDC